MKKVIFILIAVFLALPVVQAETKQPVVRLETSMGNITLTLDRDKAPLSVTNFLAYAKSGFYDGTVFHRVIPGFMIQGGGLTKSMERKPTLSPISNEADNGLKNRAGSVAMARTQSPHSATSQFFINTVDNHFLDHRKKSTQGWGYCVFGQVSEGLQVVNAIQNTRTTVRNGRRDVPHTPVVIKKVVIVQE